jgi:hypothetical protein
MLTSTQRTLSVWVENTGLPLESWMLQVEFTDGLDKAGFGTKFTLLNQAASLTVAYFKLPWRQKLTQETRYRWRFECLWVINRAYKHMLETYGQDLPLGRWIDWVQFLDTLPPELVRQWAAMSWWKRRRYARKTMTWLAYVQEVREEEVHSRDTAAAEGERRYERIITPPERYALLAQTEYMDFATCMEYATHTPGLLEGFNLIWGCDLGPHSLPIDPHAKQFIDYVHSDVYQPIIAEIKAEAALHEQNYPHHEQDTCKEDPLGL